MAMDYELKTPMSAQDADALAEAFAFRRKRVDGNVVAIFSDEKTMWAAATALNAIRNNNLSQSSATLDASEVDADQSSQVLTGS